MFIVKIDLSERQGWLGTGMWEWIEENEAKS